MTHNDAVTITTKTAPAATGFLISELSPNEIVSLVAGVLTCIYVVVQIAIAVMKRIEERREHLKRMGEEA